MSPRKTNAKTRAAKARKHKAMPDEVKEEVKKHEAESDVAAKENETAAAPAEDKAKADADAAAEAQAAKDKKAAEEQKAQAEKTVVYHLERGADVDATIVAENADGSVNLELIVPELHQHFLKDDERGAAVPKRENVQLGTEVGQYSRK